MSINRVALISYHTCPLAFLGDGKAGGMNVYVRELARSLGRRGIGVDIFTRNHPEVGQDRISIGDGVDVVHLDGGPIEASLETHHNYLPAFREAIYQYREEQKIDYQVVHSHYWLSGWTGLEVARSWGVPHVMSFHTLAQIKSQARAGEGEAPLRSGTERYLMEKSDLVVAFSPHEGQAMASLYGVSTNKIQVVPCGVDLSMFRPISMDDARKSLGLNGERVILWVGRVEPIKGLELLLKAAANMENRGSLKVLMVGGDVAKDLEIKKLQGLAKDLGVEGTVEFVGKVEQHLLPFYYSAADVCVVPSHYESFGLVALEAMACGTPVVASRVGGLATLVEHGRTGYLMNGRCPEPLADSLEVILSSPLLQRSMRFAARQRAENMSWERVAENIESLYWELVSRPTAMCAPGEGQ